ncbi:methyltransferase domain-containing protein [Colletotrichum karsti]|uniref:Methyltransferase domain-containing protein n=1 Tax=Colletotrichum karsti TaxID=1095194 RepID=A0A9P6HU20_9PEZI|nr:methyltransferase domain-containing protein [Colletotrichum karsti]KAF9869752.1 methyltransferase domain-containing protein [Colletotrichum karsti]
MTDKRSISTSPKGVAPKAARIASPPQASSPSPQSPAEETVSQANDHEEAPSELEVDDASSVEGYESASDHGSSLATSLASSIRDYNFENKRRYHKYKEGQYHFPNDEPEQERENMKHHMIVALCDNKLHNAPIKDPKKVLDIGTGTGIWAIEMGDTYPEADVEGIDLSPIQPPFVPTNVHFTVDDVEAEWLHPESSVDYIHLRHMYPSIKNWPKLLEQAYRALKPGGWLELQDIVPECKCDDDTIPPGSEYAPARMMELIKEGVATFGVDLRAGKSHMERMEKAGFRNLVHDAKKVPIGTWPKDAHLKSIGSYARAVIYDGLHGNTIGPLTRGLGWTPMEVEVFLIQCRKEMMDDSFHPYIFYHSYSAQKPL